MDEIILGLIVIGFPIIGADAGGGPNQLADHRRIDHSLGKTSQTFDSSQTELRSPTL
ncbi:MAG: hypothetical protein AAB774_02105 [Patescibacteria group bacterium]